MRQFLHVTGLPTPIAAGIGRMMMRWSRQEHIQRKLLYILLGLSEKEARIVFREPRVKDYLTMIKQTASLRGIDLQVPPELSSNRLDAIENKRNLVAHGIWLRDPQTRQLCVRATTGTIQQIGTVPLPSTLQGVSRKILPQAIPIDITFFRDAQKEMMVIRRAYEAMTNQVRRELRRKRSTSSKKRK